MPIVEAADLRLGFELPVLKANVLSLLYPAVDPGTLTTPKLAVHSYRALETSYTESLYWNNIYYFFRY